MTEPIYRRWAAAYDRRQQGDVLSDAEQAELDRWGAEDPACRQELALREALRGVPEPGAIGPAERRLVERVLANAPSSRNVIPLRVAGAPALPPPAEPPTVAPTMATTVATTSAWLRIGGSLAGVACAAGLALWFSRSEGIPSEITAAQRGPAPVELTFASGAVLADDREVPTTDGSLDVTRSLRTTDGRACVSIDVSIDVCLGADTEIRLGRLSGTERVVELVRGIAAASLEKQPPGHHFRIQAGAVRATAVGTAFAVERVLGEDTSVTVLEGVVRTDAGEHEARLQHHEQLRVAEGRAPEVRRVSRSEQSRISALLAPASEWKHESVGVLHVESVPPGAVVSVDGKWVGVTPMMLVAPIGRHTLLVELEGHERRGREIVVRGDEPTQTRIELATVASDSVASDSAARDAVASDSAASDSASVGPAPRARSAEARSAKELLGQARALVQQGSWSAAARAYQDLRASHPRSSEAHTVLVALGQLQLDRLGRPAAALRSYSAYLAGGGPLNQEARFGTIRALRALGYRARERAAIEEYLAKHPGGVDASSLRKRLAQLK